MLEKFEQKTSRVKGLAFHPQRPWILAALHNGHIHLYDYQTKTLVESFQGHEGPVRGIAFHASQPLFVSGGDDYKIKQWHMKQRKSIFTLTGHLDYIRTVQYHPVLPWILSCSDDQTIRIWNWQNRSCLAVLTGHNHYVMCAQFHWKEEWIVSASLDQTVRIWDFSGLKKKGTSAPRQQLQDEVYRVYGSNTGQGSSQQQDPFTSGDVFVRHVLEGHERGVNWAAFHPSLPIVVSGADDRTVRLWRLSETRATDMGVCRGHGNNVSCVLFHPKYDVLLSNSEDKTLRLWDMHKRTELHTYRRDHDRYWVLVHHPTLPLFAAGHDQGFLVFKLERERPPMTLSGNDLFLVKDKALRRVDLQTQQESVVLQLKRPVLILNGAPRSLSYNAAEKAFLLQLPTDGGCYELYQIPANQSLDQGHNIEPKRGASNGSVFVARNRFAVLDKTQQVLTIKNLSNETLKTWPCPQQTRHIFFAGTGQVLLCGATHVVLFDVQQGKVVSELMQAYVKHVYWNEDLSYAALIGHRTHVVLVTKRLQVKARWQERLTVKSGHWLKRDATEVFLFTTTLHLKYALLNGDCGIIQTLKQPLYLYHSRDETILALDRQFSFQSLTVDATEWMFKAALQSRRYERVLQLMQSGRLIGQAVIAYLRRKGYPEVALQFVKQPRMRFQLALECGDLASAYETCHSLNQRALWQSLCQASQWQADLALYEQCLQQLKQYEALSHFYSVTHQYEKLKKMMTIAGMRRDVLGAVKNACLLGDDGILAKVWMASGLQPLAWLALKRLGRDEEASAILASNPNSKEKENMAYLQKSSVLLSPPLPVQSTAQFPCLSVQRGFMEALLSGQVPNAATDDFVHDQGTTFMDAKESQHEDFAYETTATATKEKLVPVQPDENAWGVDELNLDDELDQLDDLVNVSATNTFQEATPQQTQVVAFPNRGVGVSLLESSFVADHIHHGSFDTAMQLLHRQLGVVNMTPLKEIFLELYRASQGSINLMEGLSLTASLPVCKGIATIQREFQQAQSLTSQAQFAAAMHHFRRVIYWIVTSKVQNEDELQQVKSMLALSRETLIGLMLESERKSLVSQESSRACELACYFASCQMDPKHSLMAARIAMTLCFKLKCTRTAALFARKVLALQPEASVQQQTLKVLTLCERQPQDALSLSYDALSPFVVDAKRFTPIYRGAPVVQCGVCHASYSPEEQKRMVCQVCLIGGVGVPASGLLILDEKMV